MKYLSDDMLLDVYLRAVDLQLEQAFLDLICAEMKRRNLAPAALHTKKAATKHSA